MDDLQIQSSEDPNWASLQNPKASTWRTATDQTDPIENSNLSFQVVKPATISVKDLNVNIEPAPNWFKTVGALFRTGEEADIKQKSRRKTILSHITAQMPSGSLTAIMGASGAGKTCFLDAISHRIRDSKLKTSGGILYNGNSKLSSIRSAYVVQEDALLPALTIRETLQYAADLRLASSYTMAERHKVVEEVILELGLKDCASTRIGNDARKGCSGGERRRTSLGVQMLANPSVLFLDEVTTGLDATSAFQLVRTLKCLTNKGRTIIITIHQPRSEIWGFFDRLVLLSEGQSIYSGSASASLHHFARLGYKVPQFVNPAEYLIDLAAVDTRLPKLESLSRTRVQRLKDDWQASLLLQEPKDIRDTNEIAAEITHENKPQGLGSSFARQVTVQTARTLKTTIRDPIGIVSSLAEAVSLGIIAGWIFIKLDGTLSGIRSREGALYTAAALQGYLVLLYETYRLTLDISLFDREKSEGVVGVFSYVISRRLARLLLEDLTVPLVFSTIFYFLVGFRPLASQFFVFYAVILLCHYLSVMLAAVCVAAFRDFARASLIANLSFTLQSICSGFFIQSDRIPVYVRWIKYTTYVWYANGALIYNEFLAHTPNPEGQTYDCQEPGGFDNPACKPYTGVYIVESLGFQFNSLWKPTLILVGFTLIFFFGSALLLTFRPAQLSISRAIPNERDCSAEKYNISRPLPDVRTVSVTLENYSLAIQKRSLTWKKSIIVSVLKPINTTFKPGCLNVIMGPSGSGKTSLLNMMARRLPSRIGTRYEAGGRMLFGAAIASNSVVCSMTSYVSQDDDALISTLTVRETLHFAAGLRLPMWMSKDEKFLRAESILLQLSLRDCADNLIGDAKKKGISRGEKRRVTIAVQLLTDPHILILDEPTSGLDAFTATSIIDVLRSLATEGKKTIILSIHQARSDTFKYFDHVLLLARGGQPVYSGKGQSMLSYFSALGYNCPPATNPADFALDLITVDLQDPAKETASRKEINSLILRWDKTTAMARDSVLEGTTVHVHTPAELGSLKRAPTSLHIAFPLLLRRSLKSYRRSSDIINARIAQVLGFSIIITLFWAPLKSNYKDIQGRLGFIQQQMGLYFVGMLQNVAVYPYERNLFYREHDDRIYSVEAFFLQYTVLEIPFEIVSSLLFAILVDLAAGLPRNVLVFSVEAFNAFCLLNCGESLGIMFNTLFSHSGFAVHVASVILSIALIMAGVLSINLPPFLQALNHLSPAKWSVGNLAPYTLRGQIFTCNESQRLSNGTCPITRGQQVLELYKLNFNPGLSLLALGSCTLAYRIAAYLMLRAMRTPLSKHRTRDIEDI